MYDIHMYYNMCEYVYYRGSTHVLQVYVLHV